MRVSFLTIEREYGSGGTKIARTLSEICGIPCYGKEIIEEVSKSSGYPAGEIQKYDETASNSLLYSVFALSQAISGSDDLLMKERHVFLAEQKVIKKIACRGKAIFLGHCAAEALGDMPGVIKVFIRCTDERERQRRITEEYNISPEKAESVRKRFNKKRANYFYANAERRWDDFSYYDIVLDSGQLGTEGCVAVLKGLFSNS